jgi:hypothetical protein
MKKETKSATAKTPNKPQSKRGNPQNLIVRSGAEARELGRKGGIASGAARRTRCSFAEALRHALTVPIPITSDRHGDWTTLIERFGMCDLTAQNLIVCRMIQSAIGGDVKASAFVRDTLMMSGGGIEDAGSEARIAPVTTDGRERLTVYHTLEVPEIRERMKERIDAASATDRLTHGHANGDRARIEVAEDARYYNAEGLVTLDGDANGVTVDLKGIEEEDVEEN